MKQSRYNFFFEYEPNNIICYNSRTNALARIDQELYERYKEYINGNYQLLNEDELSKFIYGGFIVDKDIDELEILREKLYQDRYDKSNLILTIAPTLKCNFACPYCYEQGDKPGSMSLELQDKIVNFIESRKDIIKTLHIAWYGGEPLLELNAIRYLSKEFIRICNESNIKYTAKVITNGYLLEKEVAEELINDLNVSSIQITIDGPPSTHNKTRILHNGDPTFEKIIDNLKDCKDIIKNIAHIRMNVSKQNYLNVIDLENILEKEGLKESISYYLARVNPNGNIGEDEFCFTPEEFNYIDRVYKKRIKVREYPTRRSRFCGADSSSSFVITSDGNLYKCWEDVGIENRSIGNLLEDKDVVSDMKYLLNRHAYIMYDPTNDDQCRECNVLPICMGGCPAKRLKNVERCVDYKYTLKEDLKNYIDLQLEATSCCSNGIKNQ